MRINMKTRLTIIALGTLLVWTGCTRADQASESSMIRLTAQAETGSTRATVDGASGAFAWESGDALAIYLSTSGFQTVTLDNTAGNFVLPAASAAARTAYSVFPASLVTNASWSGSALTVNLPTSYSITSATSDKTPLPMVAENDPGSDFLFFRHLGALVRIEDLVLPSGTTAVTVTFNKSVTGPFVVDFTGEPKIACAAPESGNNVVTFIIGTPLPTTLNIPVPCGSYSGVTLAGNVDSYSVEFPENFTLLRHQGKKLSVPEP